MAKFIDKLREFAARESMYILLVVFIIIFNLLVAASSTPEDVARARMESRAALAKRAAIDKTEDLMMARSNVEKILAAKPNIATLLSVASLSFIMILLLGFLFDLAIVSFKLQGGRFDMYTYRSGVVGWSLVDVARVVILFLFFAYVLLVIESSLVEVFPLLRSGNFRMMVNSFVLDVIGALFVIYFAVRKYNERLVTLGLTLSKFGRNIFYGVVAYIAAVPVFVGVLIFVLFLIKLTNYTPERQPVVELFLKEENPTFLICSSIFASVFGPFIEELFFRGFMYNAAKKAMGVFWAMMLTSAIFSALHTNLAGFLPIMALGMLLTYMYEKTGSLVSSITIHIIHNLAMVFFVFLAKGIGSL